IWPNSFSAIWQQRKSSKWRPTNPCRMTSSSSGNVCGSICRNRIAQAIRSNALCASNAVKALTTPGKSSASDARCAEHAPLKRITEDANEWEIGQWAKVGLRSVAMITHAQQPHHHDHHDSEDRSHDHAHHHHHHDHARGASQRTLLIVLVMTFGYMLAEAV